MRIHSNFPGQGRGVKMARSPSVMDRAVKATLASPEPEPDEEEEGTAPPARRRRQSAAFLSSQEVGEFKMDVARQAHLSVEELRILQRVLHKRHGHTGDKLIAIDQLLDALTELYANKVRDVDGYGDLVSRGFDTTGTGRVDYEEYVMFLASVTSTNLEDQLQAVFRTFDADEDGTLDTAELVSSRARRATRQQCAPHAAIHTVANPTPGAAPTRAPALAAALAPACLDTLDQSHDIAGSRENNGNGNGWCGARNHCRDDAA